MRKMLLALALSVPLSMGSADAAGAPSEYQMEAELMTIDGETAFGFNYFFTPVNNDEHPFAIQQFMQRASYVGIDAGSMRMLGFPDSLWVGGVDNVGYSIPVTYTLPGMDNRLQVTADLYDITDVMGGGMYSSIGLAYYITDTFRVATDIIGDTYSADVEFGLHFVDLQYVMPDQNLSLGFNFSLRDDAFGDHFKLTGSYYPMKELGINATIIDGDGYANTVLQIGADYQIGPVSVEAAYLTNNSGIDELFLAGRFRF